MMSAQPNRIDVHIGKIIRAQRLLRKMSQPELGEKIGVTFQQVQKYEKGHNRIAASKLYEIASVLQVEMKSFFESIEDYSNIDQITDESLVDDFVATRDAMILNSAFFALKDKGVRSRILKLVLDIVRIQNSGAVVDTPPDAEMID